MSEDRVSTGIEGFDNLIEGGIPRGSLLLLGGEAGSGKTFFAAQYLYHGVSKLDEPGIYVSFAENRETFLKNMKRLNMDFEKYEQAGRFRLMDLVTVTEKGVGEILDSVLAEISNLKAKRLVIDSFSAMAQAFKEPIEARVVVHTILGKMVRQAGCTTLLVVEKQSGQERIGLGLEEFVADNVMILRRRILDDRLVRELEIVKMRGTRVQQPVLLFNLNGGFKVVKPYLSKDWQQPSNLKPVKPKSGFLSTGIEDLDELIGGGLPPRSYNVLEVGATVPLSILRLVRPLIIQALTHGHGVFILPAMGISARQVKEGLTPYVRTDLLNRLVRVVDYGDENKEPYCVRLTGAKIQSDFLKLWKTVHQLHEASKKTVLAIVGFDTVEYMYGLKEGLRILGRDVALNRNIGDVRVNIIRPSVHLKPQLVEVADTHLVVDEIQGALVAYGVKPRTAIHDFNIKIREGTAEIKLTPVI